MGKRLKHEVKQIKAATARLFYHIDRIESRVLRIERLIKEVSRILPLAYNN